MDRFSIKEKILLHLMEYPEIRKKDGFSEHALFPFHLSQEGMADSVMTARSLVSRALSDLAEEGLIGERLAHIRGKKKRMNIYFLTDEGLKMAAGIKENAENTVVLLKEKDKLEEMKLSEVKKLKKDANILDLVNTVAEDGTLDLNMLREKREFIDFSEIAPEPGHFFGRKKELTALKKWVEGFYPKIVVVKGIAGIGKTTLIAKIVSEYKAKKNVFWYRFHDWSTLKNMLTRLSDFLYLSGRRQLKIQIKSKETIDMEKISAILKTHLKNADCLLVFDDFHKAKEPEISFFSSLADILEGADSVKVIVMGRWIPPFYSRKEVIIRKTVSEMLLQGLDESASRELLRERNIKTNLKKLYLLTGGHPLCLEFVDEAGAAAPNIARYIQEEIFSKLTEKEKNALSIASVFRYPFKENAFFIADDEIGYDTIDRLVDKSLLQISGGVYDTHDLIRALFYSRMIPKTKAELHRRTADYYLNEKNDASYVEAIYHLLKAGDKEGAIKIVDEKGQGIIEHNYSNELISILKEFNMNEIQNKIKNMT
ncbi:MAG: AAA family ATPase [Thermoplasmatales archaeon]|nr:AAA family ATPase [Thermoplasmatales archaeon]